MKKQEDVSQAITKPPRLVFLSQGGFVLMLFF